MPELPEVETVVRQLRPRLVGRTVARVALRWPGVLDWPGLSRPATPRAFRAGLVGRRIEALSRRGKYLVFALEGGAALVGHLRMTGRFFVVAAGAAAGAAESAATAAGAKAGVAARSLAAWVRAELDLDDGSRLVFVDTRKFGRLVLVPRAEDAFPRLGPEPLERAVTDAWFHQALASRRRLLKPLLLDQAFLAGLGNIYADESLHRAGLHPLTRSDRVGAAGAARLRRAVRHVLVRAIAREGSSFDAFYRTPEGRPGGYQDEFLVYDRAGEPCRGCGAAIRRIVVAQRGTHFCPGCQGAPRAARRARSR